MLQPLRLKFVLEGDAMTKPRLKVKRHQSGSFVIEALISVLLFAIGLVSMVMISAQSSNQVGQSRYRNEASYLASELIGEMWVSASAPAAFNRTDWNTRVAAMLPGGDSSGTSVTGSRIDVVITWSDVKQPDMQHQYTTSAEIVKN